MVLVVWSCGFFGVFYCDNGGYGCLVCVVGVFGVCCDIVIYVDGRVDNFGDFEWGMFCIVLFLG